MKSLTEGLKDYFLGSKRLEQYTPVLAFYDERAPAHAERMPAIHRDILLTKLYHWVPTAISAGSLVALAVTREPWCVAGIAGGEYIRVWTREAARFRFNRHAREAHLSNVNEYTFEVVAQTSKECARLDEIMEGKEGELRALQQEAAFGRKNSKEIM